MEMADVVGVMRTEWPTGVLATSPWTKLAAPLLLMIWIFFKVLGSDKRKECNLPPGPYIWPIVGNIFHMVFAKKPIHQAVDDLTKIYGPLMLLKVGVQNFVFVSDSELTLEFLKLQDSQFAHRPRALYSARYLLYGEKHLTMGQPGAYHNFLRKLLMTELLGQKKMQLFQTVRMEEHDFFTKEAYNASLRKESFNLNHHVHAMTINIIASAAFSKKFFGPAATKKLVKGQKRWPVLMKEVTVCFSIVLAETCNPAWRWVDTINGSRARMQRCFREMDCLLQEILDTHRMDLDALSPKEREEYEPKDLMDIILSLSKDEATDVNIDDCSIKAISLDLIVAGSETSSMVTEWAMTELLINPHVMKKAQEELDRVVGKERLVTEADLPNLPYLAAVVKETFRMHEPVAWLLPHSNRVPCQVAGYNIPKDSFIHFNVYGMSRNSSNWDDPLKFDPERFLSGKYMHIDVKGSYPQLLPFGMGRRICPGLAFSQVVMHTNLARYIHTFDWSLPGGVTVEQLDVSEGFSAVAGKRIPLEAVPTPRLAPHVYESLLSTSI